MKTKSLMSWLVRIISILVLFPALLFPNQADTVIVRLKNGAKIKGEVIKRTENSIVIQNHIVGVKEIKWEDITLLGSSEVYDSLQENKSLLVLPPPKMKRNFLMDNLSAEFMGGKIFSYDRFVGFGVRANILLYDVVTFGGIAILHLGRNSHLSPDGYSSLFYWGPELGLRIFTEYLILEPSFSIGEGSYQVGNNSEPRFFYYDPQQPRAIASIQSDLFLAPGLSAKINFGSMKLGFQYKYIIINNQQMSGLYISFGN